MGVFYDVVTLFDEIKEQRNALYRIASLTQDLRHPSVLRASQRLDKLIVRAQRQTSHLRQLC